MEVEAGGVEGTDLQCTRSTHGCCSGQAGGEQGTAPGEPAALLWARSCSASGSSSSRTCQREREGPVSCCNVTHSAAIIPGFLARKERVSLGWLFLCCIYPKISLAPSAVLFQEPWDAVCTSTPGTQLCFP